MKHLVALLFLVFASCAAVPPRAHLLPTNLGQQVFGGAASPRIVVLAHDIAHAETFAAHLRASDPRLFASLLPAARIGIKDPRPRGAVVADCAATRSMLWSHWEETSWRRTIAAAAKNPYLSADRPAAILSVRIGVIGHPASSRADSPEGEVMVQVLACALAGDDSDGLSRDLFEFSWESGAPSSVTEDGVSLGLAAAAKQLAHDLRSLRVAGAD